MRAGGLGELRGEAALTMRQPFIVARCEDDPEKRNRESGRGSTEDEREEEEREECSMIFALSCFILTRLRPYWAEDFRLDPVTAGLAHSPPNGLGEQPPPRCEFQRCSLAVTIHTHAS